MATLEEMKERRRRWKSSSTEERRKQDSYGKKYHTGRRPVSYRTREFIAWDGEGADVNGVHQYVLLMNSKGDVLSMPEGIPTQVALDFLCNGKEKYPDAIHVVFGGSYDVNMILRDLPYNYMKLLQKNHRVYWRYFNIQYIARKYFMVSRYDKHFGDKRKKKALTTLSLWDVIGFFQGTFVKSLQEYFPDREDQEQLLHIPEIESGKQRRGTFTRDELESFVIPYTRYEVEALVHLMNKLRLNFLDAGIHLSRWDGAGAAAAAVLKSYGVKKYYPVNMLTELEQAGQVAYGGGHVEMYKYGHYEGIVHHYDIIGAYPSVMPELPNIANGEWLYIKDDMFKTIYPNNKNYFSLYKIYWDFYNTPEIYPFFYRYPWGSEPRIYYPSRGYSWIWQPELEVALKWLDTLGGYIKVLEKWEFVPGDDVRPFDFVEELYKKRLEYKAAGMGAALALKLAVNSFYGKMAQTVGYDPNVRDKKPPFYNILYAGYVTSRVRARMMDAILQAPESVIAVATDGLWSLQELSLNVGKNLGQWEYERLSSFTSIQAGVYFATKEKESEKIYHYRGFNQGSISESDVIQHWKNRDYTMHIPTRRFVTMGTALASESRFLSHWRRWEEDTRELELFPGSRQKRFGKLLEDGRPSPECAYKLLDTSPNMAHRFEDIVHSTRDLTEQHLSRKHPLPWDTPIPQSLHSEKIAMDEARAWEVTESEL